jgi:hypothetical protein
MNFKLLRFSTPLALGRRRLNMRSGGKRQVRDFLSQVSEAPLKGS